MTHPIYFIAAIGLFFGVLLSLAGYAWHRWPRAQNAEWESLLAQLNFVDRDKIALIALEMADESGDSKAAEASNLEAGQIWRLIGGLDGLEILESNSEVLIELAIYVQRWYPDAARIAERLEQDAREIKWHVSRLKGAAETGNLQISFPFYAQRAVVTYYRMTCRVLELYQSGNFALLADLQKAI